VLADRTRLKQIPLNLSNALKYNREHGEVRIAARRSRAGACASACATRAWVSMANRWRCCSSPSTAWDRKAARKGSGIGLVVPSAWWN
jgi:K+-sensing histidine kinase KdpD